MYEDHCGMVTKAAQEFGAHGDLCALCAISTRSTL